MPNPTNLWHRTQKVGDAVDPEWRTGCGIYSSLSGIADATSGAVGPAVSGRQFRSYQRDQVGGIDLYDCKVAAARLGIEMILFANYDAPREYPGMARAYPSASIPTLLAYVKGGHPVRVDGDYEKIPAPWSCQNSYDGPHGIVILAYGYRETPARELLVSDPLCATAKWEPLSVVAGFAAATAGIGKANIGVLPARTRLVVSVSPGLFWKYHRKPDGSWGKTLTRTIGFTQPCDPAISASYGRRAMRLVRVTGPGKHNGSWLNELESAVSTKWSPI
jgi:hypothetical protein